MLRRRDGDFPGVLCLAEQHFEIRYIVVPFDQRRAPSDGRDRVAVKLPYGVGYRTAVVVDPDLPAIGGVDRVAGQMNLLDQMSRDKTQIETRVLTLIAGTDEDIVDVEQEATASWSFFWS
jgi:hypothetical protein